MKLHFRTTLALLWAALPLFAQLAFGQPSASTAPTAPSQFTGKKLQFIVVTASWGDQPFQRLQASMQEPLCANMMGKYFQQQLINLEEKEGKEMAKKFEIDAVPTILVMDADGNLIRKVEGAQESERLMSIMKNSLVESGTPIDFFKNYP